MTAQELTALLLEQVGSPRKFARRLDSVQVTIQSNLTSEPFEIEDVTVYDDEVVVLVNDGEPEEAGDE